MQLYNARVELNPLKSKTASFLCLYHVLSVRIFCRLRAQIVRLLPFPLLQFSTPTHSPLYSVGFRLTGAASLINA